MRLVISSDPLVSRQTRRQDALRRDSKRQRNMVQTFCKNRDYLEQRWVWKTVTEWRNEQSVAWLMLDSYLQKYEHREVIVVIATVSCEGHQINESSQDNQINKRASSGGSIGRRPGLQDQPGTRKNTDRQQCNLKLKTCRGRCYFLNNRRPPLLWAIVFTALPIWTEAKKCSLEIILWVPAVGPPL